MPTEAKPITGLFKWKDVKRWHTTWHAYLCNHLDNKRSSQMLMNKKFLYFLLSSRNLASPEDPVSAVYFEVTSATNYDSDLLGQEL